MRFLLALSLSLICAAAQAQPTRVRGTISGFDGKTLLIDGKTKVLVGEKTEIVFTQPITFADIKPGTYVGVTSVPQGGKQVAKEVHLIPPAAPSGHMDWDLVPGSKMTNANLQAAVAAAGGNEITLKYKDGEQKIMVPSGTPIVGFDNGDRSALKKGETIWTNARVEGDGKLVANRVQVSKGGVKPEH